MTRKMLALQAFVALAPGMCLDANASELLPGIKAEYFAFGDFAMTAMPDLDGLNPDLVRIEDTIDHPMSTDVWDGLGSQYADNFAVRYTALLDMESAGDYVFTLESDDGSALWIDGVMLIDNSATLGMHSDSVSVTVEAGHHELRVDYFEHEGNSYVSLKWAGENLAGETIPADAFSQDIATDIEGYAELYGIDDDLWRYGEDGEAELVPPATAEDSQSSLGSGLAVEYYSFGGTLLSLPDFSALRPDAVGIATNVYCTKDGLYSFLTRELGFDGFFASRHLGKIRIPSTGRYFFRLLSHDGSGLLIDGKVIVDNDGLHYDRDISAPAFLSAGLHDVEVRFFGQCRDRSLLQLGWRQPGETAYSTVPAEVFFHQLPLNCPPNVSVTSPASGEVLVTDGVASLSANAGDFDGSVAEVVYFYTDGERIGASSATPWTVAWTNRLAGSVDVIAVATDNGGLPTTSTPVRVTFRDPPQGCASGLEARFYSLDESPSALSDFTAAETSLVACVTSVTAKVDYPCTAEAWDGLPSYMTDNFAAVFTGYLFVERSGTYTIKLTSDDGSELWLDGAKIIDNGLFHVYFGYSAEVELAAGLHPILIRYYEGSGDSGLSLEWSDGSGLRTVGVHELVRVVGTLDADGDGCPGWWEAIHGLSDSDPSDASLDSDGDGVGNLDEYRVGTDPRSSDTDTDGMPDGWEVAHGTKPFVADRQGDPDGDGLGNLAEYTAGTDPSVADTDGDGCPDGVEVFDIRSNPLVADILWNAPTQVGSVSSAVDTLARTGTWSVDTDGVLFAGQRAGSLTWRLTVPAAGADAVAVKVVQHEFYATESDFDLSLEVDGIYISRTIVHAPCGNPAEAVFFIPEVVPGEHEFRLVWHNWSANTFMGVVGLRFLDYGGPDADGDGVPDWKGTRSEKGAALGQVPCESLVSPYCVEGSGMWGDVFEIGADYGASNAVYTAIRTIGDGFYANIPLAEDGPARIAVSDGVRTDEVSVAWSELDVFSNAYATNALVIRKGDSLRIGSGGRSGTAFELSRAAYGNWHALTNWTCSAARVRMFDEAGEYLISATHDGILGSETGYAIVDVVESAFPNRNPAVLLQATRVLECPDLAERNVVEYDSGLTVSAQSMQFGGVELSIYAAEDRDYGLVSRLSENGPVSDAVQVTPVWFDNGTYCRVARTYADGSQLVEVSLLLGAFPEGTTVEITIFVAGVTFEDGTRTKVLTAADFDENGMCTIRFIKARGVTTSVCHRTYIRQNGTTVLGN